MKIAIIIQRYGPQIIGGAESHAWQLAEQLFRLRQHHIHIYTSQALSYKTWKNEISSKVETYDGIKVYRFPVLFGRIPSLFSNFNFIAIRVIKKLKSKIFWPLRWLLEWLWIILQGPFTPALIKSLRDRQEEYDQILFFTYLYYPTIKGLRTLDRPCLIIPTAHDEPALNFRIIQSALKKAGKILANTPSEAMLLEDKLGPLLANRITVLGVGLSLPVSNRVCYSESLYFLYVGRVGKAKNVHRLISHFQHYRNQRPPNSNIRLVIAGKMDEDFRPPTDDSSIQFLGVIGEEKKIELLQNAIGVINPSQYESLSLLILEALACLTPAAVNGECEVLKQYSETCPTVFSYTDQNSFFTALDRCISMKQDKSTHRLLVDSQQWAVKHFSWDTVMEKFDNILLQKA